MLKNLPTTPETLLTWTWPEIDIHYKDLESRVLDHWQGGRMAYRLDTPGRIDR